MANSLKKFIAVLSASAVVASVMPIAFAETEDEIDDAAEVVEAVETDKSENTDETADIETAESNVLYDENFETFTTGKLIDLGSAKNDTYADNGFSFECGTRSGEEASLGVSVISDSENGNALNIFATKYNSGGRGPRIILTKSGAEYKFENDVVVRMDLKFSSATANTLNVVDSGGTAIPIIPTAEMVGKWVTATVVSTDTQSYVIVTDKESSGVIGFTPSTTIIKDADRITLPENQNTVQSLYIDNLYVADDEYVISDDIILAAAVNSLTIAEGQMGMEVKDGVYHVGRDIALPADPDGASVEWTLSQRLISDEAAAWEDTSFALVDGTSLVLSATEDSSKYYVKATATITVGELTDTKEFLFVIEQISEEEAAIRYDENFDGFASGTIVNLSNGSNASYKDTNGFTFSCGTRDTSSNETGVFVDTVSGTDKYMYLCQTRYNGQGRQPVVNLTRTNSTNFANAVYLEMDLKFSTSDSGVQLYVQDSSNRVVELSAPDDAHLGVWLHYVLAASGSGTAVIIYDADGKPVSYHVDGDSIKNVAKFTTADIVVTSIGINNLVISDKKYKIPDADIVEAAKSNIDITTIASKDGVYTATTDFELPSSPIGATVTWQAMQKPKDSDEWTDSSFITVSGTWATINPTSDIDNYDVKLVATITAGGDSGTKDFVIDLPNPMDEITGFISAFLPVVDTVDKNSADKVITFDLSGTDVLKTDLALPISGKTYKNTKAAWTSSDSEHISIADDGTATIVTSDLNTHDVTLTAVVTYNKGGITYSSEPQKFTVKMGYTADDVASDNAAFGKYKVRFDAAYSDNFKNIPSTTTSDLTLPSKGQFGSDISWSSSVPTSISNQGKVKKNSNTKTVTLTASIVSGTASAEKKFTITVPGTATSSSGGGGGGGGGGGASVSSTGTRSKATDPGQIDTPKTAVVEGETKVNGEQAVDKLLEEKAQSQDLFKDISSAVWAREAINGLAKAGVINGMTDTQFAPNATVTRAQFAKMLMGTFGFTSSSYTTSSFGDVATDAWYFDAVETAYNLGIITGVDTGVFAPDALITRQDMAVMVTRAAEAAEKTITEVSESKNFSDSYRISDYAQSAVDTLVKAGIINGVSDTEFAPLDNATRAQAAKILYNFL